MGWAQRRRASRSQASRSSRKACFLGFRIRQLTESLDTPHQLLILGASGHGLSVMEAAISMGFTVAGFVDPNASGEYVWGLPLFGRTDQDLVEKYHLALGIGDNHQRARVFNTIRQEFPKSSFPAVIHKSAVVASSASIGEGTVVLALGYVGAQTRVGRGVIVNSVASLDHESAMKDFSSLAPGARTGGNVTIGRHTTIGMNSAVLQGLAVGDDAVIGALSLVRTDIDESSVAYGIPARVIRQRLAE